MMKELTAEEYKGLDVNPMHCYNSLPFTELNSNKVDRLRFFAWFEDDKLRATVILGENSESLRSPFSAPFGGFDCMRDPSDELVEQIFSDLGSMAAESGKPVIITLPPSFYSPSVEPFAIHAINDPAIEVVADYNYHFTTSLAPDYDLHLTKDGRKNLRKANNADFKFQLVMDHDKKRTVYDIIRQNRESQGYPLRMSFEQVMATAEIIRIDFFIMHDRMKNPVAAAICYHVTPEIVQVIYWGDLIEYRSSNPMSLLAARVFLHYYEAGVRIVDAGPSSTDGVPNRGLCSFKRRIGCELSSKVTIKLK